MRRFWRHSSCFLIAFVPCVAWGELTAPLLLALIADVAIAVSIVRALGAVRAARSPISPVSELDARLVLLRRTVPHLRQHRPTGVIELQIRWRARAEAAAARRRGTL